MIDPGAADDAQPTDLRFTSHERNRITVDRDLGADGHLARGDKTRMSRINISARGRPADAGERDPAFVEREAAAPVDPAAPPVVATPESAVPALGLMHRLGRLFGR